MRPSNGDVPPRSPVGRESKMPHEMLQRNSESPVRRKLTVSVLFHLVYYSHHTAIPPENLGTHMNGAQ